MQHNIAILDDIDTCTTPCKLAISCSNVIIHNEHLLQLANPEAVNNHAMLCCMLHNHICL